MWTSETILTRGGTELSKAEFHETHTAQVILSGDLAFKRRRPVNLFNGLIEYETLAERWQGARNECEIGRRISPEVYRGIFSLGDGNELHEDERSHEEPIVVMERLPSDYRADVLFSRGAFNTTALTMAEECASFHARCERQGNPAEHVAATIAVWRKNFDLLPVHHPLLPLSIDQCEELLRTTDEWFDSVGHALLYRRALAGKVIEGHGGLHLKHVYLENPAWKGTDRRWAVIDPLEFSRELRVLDVGAEIGFLAMELDALGRRSASEMMVESYARLTNDSDLWKTLPFFCRYRAVVRGLVAWATAKTFSDPAESLRQKDIAGHYFQLALGYRLSVL